MRLMEDKEARLARIWLAVFLGIAAMWPNSASAQAPELLPEPVRVGDRFTYDIKDEITGDPKGTYVSVVAEVSEKEITTAISFRGKSGSQLVVLDRDWNRIDDSIWKYKPNNGQGVRLPLTVGKTWRLEYYATNLQSGVVLRSSGVSKVVAPETVTTPAGTFETFKVESHVMQNSTLDATKGSQTDITTWYAPAIHHWVRRTFVTRSNRRVRSSTSEELADFSRKM